VAAIFRDKLLGGSFFPADAAPVSLTPNRSQSITDRRFRPK